MSLRLDFKYFDRSKPNLHLYNSPIDVNVKTTATRISAQTLRASVQLILAFKKN